MKIMFLGTGASEGIPSMFCSCKLCEEARAEKVFHTRSQLLVNDDLLIDFPPDTYLHSLSYGVNLGKVENVLITHSHSDHFYPEDFVLRGQWSSFDMPSENLCVYGNEATRELFGRCEKDFNYTADENARVNGYKVYPHSTEFFVKHTFETFDAGKYKVTALPAVHIAGEECFNFIIDDGEKKILYATDTGYPEQKYFDYLKNSGIVFDAIIVDSTYGTVKAADNGHMNFEKCAEFANELKKLEAINDKTKCFLTHVFHGAATDLKSLVKAVPSGYELPADGYSVII